MATPTGQKFKKDSLFSSEESKFNVPKYGEQQHSNSQEGLWNQVLPKKPQRIFQARRLSSESSTGSWIRSQSDPPSLLVMPPPQKRLFSVHFQQIKKFFQTNFKAYIREAVDVLDISKWLLTLLEVLNSISSIHAFVEPFVVGKIKCVS